MAVGLIEKLGGVGAFIVDPQRERFLTIEELRTKRSTSRLAGQQSLPMETVNPGEGLKQAFNRLNTEEIQLVNFGLWMANYGSLGRIEIADAVVLHAYFFELPDGIEVRLGSEVEEVCNPTWVAFEEVLEEPKGSFRFRSGVREVVHLYLEYSENPNLFKPKIRRFADLEDKIPPEIFDLVEGGVTVEAALSQLCLAWRPATVFPQPTRLQHEPLFA